MRLGGCWCCYIKVASVRRGPCDCDLGWPICALVTRAELGCQNEMKRFTSPKFPPLTASESLGIAARCRALAADVFSR
eukprot:6177236-Pleurochrysis_carterae.AAC.2